MSFDDFEGAAAIRQAWLRGLAPDPALTVSAWADQHRYLSTKTSAEPGRYRTSRTPYLREIMDALSPSHPAQRITFMKSAQVGATEAGNNWIGFVIHNAPGPMLAVQPRVEDAKKFSRQRLDSLIDETEVVRERVAPARSRDARNTVFAKDFPGGVLVLTGANSAAGLRSMPARFLFMDEVDAYPVSADDEGDPVTLAVARTTTFAHRRKVFMVSTPTIKGVSRIEAEFEVSDQRRYFVPCPECGHMQWLKFERLRWEKGRPETAAYHCEACDVPMREHHKPALLAAGEWRPTAEARDPAHRGYHISALYSPVGWKSWSALAQDWEAAQGSDARLQVAKNTLLGETWTESGDAPEWDRLADRRRAYPAGAQIPAGGLYLTAGADVQADRIEVDVWAWGRGLESWLVDHIVIPHSPHEAAAWEQMTEILGRTWMHENGSPMQIARLAIDSGFETSAVYGWARSVGFAQVSPIKGVEGFNRSAPVAGPTYVDATVRGRRLRRGARLWTVAVSTFKQETYRFLRARSASEDEAAAPGVVHLPDWIDTEWIKQLVSEQLVTVRTRRGLGRLEWQKLRERNEALDLRIYARAAAWIDGIDRWPEQVWRELEARRGVAHPEVPDPGPQAPGPVGPARGRGAVRPTRRRRLV